MKTKKFRVKQFHEIEHLINDDWNHLMNKYCGKVVEFYKTRDICDRLYCDTHPCMLQLLHLSLKYWAVRDEEAKRWWVFKECWLTSLLPTFIEVDE